MTLGNQAPSVTLTGPASVRAREIATFRATASDADGTISTYLFDFDGDGTYELDSDGMPEASTIFQTRGRRTIGVQVLDDAGAAAFATLDVNVARAARKPDTRPPLRTFRLSRTSFGGAAKRSLVDHLPAAREGAGGGQAAARAAARAADRPRRAQARPLLPDPPASRRTCAAARYTVRIFVAAASGKRQVAQLSARRR